MSGWVRLNAVVIWLSSLSVAPDHMVCQVMSTTFPFVDLAGVEAAVPPQPARASTAAAATSAAGLRARPVRVRPARVGCWGLLFIARCSFTLAVGRASRGRGQAPRSPGR